MSAALNGTGGVTCPAGASPGDAGCEYWNPFMSAGLPNAETLGLANSQELADFVTPLNTSIFESDYMDFSVSVQGELPFELSGGSVGLVAGYHFRKDDLQITRDSLAQSAGFVNQQGVGTNNIEGSQEVDAFFFELALPVTNTLNIQAAGRYEDSSAGYDSFDPKIGINWQPRDDVTFRGSWGTSFRAPSIIHTAEVDIRERRFLFLADPNNPNNGGAAMMANFRVVSEQSGNPNLQPQSSENLTLGTDLQLNEIFNWDEDRGRLSLGIDYFNITMDDQIVVETTAARLQNPECHILEPTINDPRGEESGVWELLPVNPETDAMGNPALLGSCFAFRDNGTGLYDPNALNVVDTVFGTSVNRPGFDMQSIDFNLTYAVETRFGYFTARPRGTWMIDYEITERVGAAPVDTVGQYFAAGVILPNVAEWRVNVPLGLQFGSQREHQLTFTPRFTSGLDEFSGDGTEDLGSVVYFDLNYAWNAERFLPGLRLSAFVNNITAEHESDVDLVAAAGSLYPPWRRRFGLQMNYSFD
jgi:outer membrane receptor protein involved in Fe transport